MSIISVGPTEDVFVPCSIPCCGGTSAAQMYSLGGDNSTPAVVATADKTDMGAETTAAASSANLSQARWELASVGNPSVAGYFVGGNTTQTTGYAATADKLTFSNDTTAAATSANSSAARAQLFGNVGDRSTKGYFAGGLNGGGKLTLIDKLTFSGDSTSALSAVLTQARFALGGLTGDGTKGYFAGGDILGGTPAVVTAEKMTFSGDSIAAQASANLSTARFRLSAGSDGTTKGYWAGGQNGSPLSTCDKILFSTDTTSVLGSVSFANDSGASGSDATKLFSMGGHIGASGVKMTFATDTESPVGSGSLGNLSQSRTQLAGVSTSAL